MGRAGKVQIVSLPEVGFSSKGRFPNYKSQPRVFRLILVCCSSADRSIIWQQYRRDDNYWHGLGIGTLGRMSGLTAPY